VTVESEFFKSLVDRIESLERRVARLPCDHVGFPIDKEVELDEEGFEGIFNFCRNCGQSV
tara:strand:- start:106 stop:285 length:180 start_codon:yes stop_codon:yes gene_type:complete